LNRSVLLLALLVALPASAQICPALEFAEMDAMSAEELLPVRCKYRENMLVLSDSMKPKDDLRQAQLALLAANRCSDQITRMDRILARKYAIAVKPDDVYMEISKRCK